jgi:hypothetical protein
MASSPMELERPAVPNAFHPSKSHPNGIPSPLRQILSQPVPVPEPEPEIILLFIAPNESPLRELERVRRV